MIKSFGKLEENEIVELEKKINRKLPGDYKEFLRNNNGGTTDGEIICFNAENIKEGIVLDVLYGINLSKSLCKFNVDYDYTDLSDADDYERQIIWEYKYLGIEPPIERKRDREIIEKYLRWKSELPWHYKRWNTYKAASLRRKTAQNG